MSEWRGDEWPRTSAREAARLRVRVFGPLRVSVDGIDLALGSPKERALLAILISCRGEVVQADRLVELLWGRAAPRTAEHSVHVYVSRLRGRFTAALGSPLIETLGTGYRLPLHAEELDASAFEAALDRARRHPAGDPPASERTAALEEALATGQGEPLEDLSDHEQCAQYAAELRADRDWAREQLALALAVGGRPERALTLAAAVLRSDPLREASQEALMIALARLGRGAEALRSYARFRKNLAEELGVDPSPRLGRLHERILVQDPRLVGASLAGSTHETGRGAPNPYKGLRSFEEADAENFFGREPIVQELLARLTAGLRLITVVGPSGSGKSSLLSAGLVPAAGAAGRDWRVVRPDPGARGPDAMDAAVRVAIQGTADRSRRVVLVLDHLEDIFLDDSAAVSTRLLDRLVEAISGAHPVALVAALRADFFEHPLRHQNFGPLFATSVLTLPPLTAEQVEAAVVRPAMRAGVGVEAALLSTVISDLGIPRAELPLLQFVLAELYDRRTGRSLTLADYRSLGGVAAAFSLRAESMRLSLTQSEQHTLTQVCLRLFRSDDRFLTLRRTSVAELTALEGVDTVVLARVLSALSNHRLVVLDRDDKGAATVCLSHETALSAWPWLAAVVERARDTVVLHQRLVGAGEEWELSSRDVDYLWPRSRLEAVLAACASIGLELTARERDFIEAGLAKDRVAVEVALASADRISAAHRSARRRLVMLLGALSALLGVGAASAALLRDRPVHVAVADMWGGQIAADVRRGVDHAAASGGVAQVSTAASMETAAQVTNELASSGAGLVITSTLGVPVGQVARAHPDTRFFAYADGPVELVPNVTYAEFADQQTAYLAGAAAALTTKTGRIGFLGGADTVELRRFEAGYLAGAHSAAPTVKVDVSYVTRLPDYDGFGTPSLAAGAAAAMLGRGADVIYAASGASQTGTFQAVIDASARSGRQMWAIGADDDAWADTSWQRTSSSRDHILTSTVKRFDLASYEAVRDFQAGRLHAGVRVYDVRNGGLVLSMQGDHLAPILGRLQALTEAVADGRVVVPCIPDGATVEIAREASLGPECPLQRPH